MSSFFKEKITIQHSPFATAAFLDAVRAQIVDRLDSQGQPHDPDTVIFAQNPNSIGSVLGFSWTGELRVEGPNDLNATQSLGFYVNTDDAQVFLGKREADLGKMAKNFINGLGNSASQITSLQDIAGWIDTFRDVFPILESTRS